MGLTMMSESLHVQAGRGAMPIENGQGQDAGGGEPRALTVSNVIKEIQVLKDKFKNDDEDHCKSAHATHVLASDWVGRGVYSAAFFSPQLHTAAVSPYQDLEKATVLQECRVFHDSNIVTSNPRLCCQLITKLLHIITQVLTSWMQYVLILV
jgi:coatomer protein complex subunit gamma